MPLDNVLESTLKTLLTPIIVSGSLIKFCASVNVGDVIPIPEDAVVVVIPDVRISFSEEDNLCFK